MLQKKVSRQNIARRLNASTKEEAPREVLVRGDRERIEIRVQAHEGEAQEEPDVLGLQLAEDLQEAEAR